AGEPELRVVFYFSLGSALAGVALTAAAGGPSAHSPRGLLLLAAIGLLAALAQLTLTRAYNIGHTLSNAALQYMGIVFSFGFGVWLFGDRVSAGAIVGVLLIVGAGLAASRAAPSAATPARAGAE
ncbi:MAG: EamA/RhaT family transporter, partial [Burkholderiales bacterium]|nr:EamA/RhaT family transporter [Burkholderiales bacterium]